MRIRLEEKLEEATGPRQDSEKTQFYVTDSSSIPHGAALADGAKPWETRHLRLEQGDGTTGKGVVLSHEKVQATTEVLDEHGGPAKLQVLAAEWEALKERERN